MKKLLLAFFYILYVMPCFATQSKSDGVKFADDWFAGVGFTADYKCKGTSEKMGLDLTSVNNKDRPISTALKDMYIDFRAEEYIAREINQNGALFCKTIIGGGRKNCHNSPYTTYFDPAEKKDCFWLCKQGHYGNGCFDPTKPTSNSTSKSIQEYRAIHPNESWSPLRKISTIGADVEASVPMFKYDQYLDCGDISKKNLNSSHKQEHDVVLMLYNVAETKENEEIFMLVVPVVVRAGGTRGCWGQASQHTAWPMLSAHGLTHTAVCPSDYQQVEGYIYAGDPDSNYVQQAGCEARGKRVSDDDAKKVKVLSPDEAKGRATGLLGTCYVEPRIFCVPPAVGNSADESTTTSAATSAFEDKKQHLCDEYDGVISLYDEKLHDLVVVNSKTYASDVYAGESEQWVGKCALMKCKDATKNFKADWLATSDVGCYDCTGKPGRYGVNKKGVCEQCADKKEIFSANTGTCVTALTATKNDMRYGVGNDSSNKLEDQCWAKDTPTDYKNCVVGGTTVENVGSL